MSRKKRKNKNYNICGVIEVINITKGRRCATILNLDEKPLVENLEISGSIVTKSPIYKRDAPNTEQEENIFGSGSCDEG